MEGAARSFDGPGRSRTLDRPERMSGSTNLPGYEQPRQESHGLAMTLL
jgi:hypothetical protein